MLQGEQIVCIAFPKWAGDYLKSTVQLATELAVHNDVLYVDYPYTWKDLIAGIVKGGDAPVKRLLGGEPALERKELANGAAIHLLTLPPFLPANWLDDIGKYDRVLQYNAKRALRRIEAACSALAFDRPIMLNAFSPALGSALFGRLDAGLHVYYCYDEIGATAWAGKHGAYYERLFLRQVDLTIVSSQTLYEQKQPATSQCEVVKNGVGELFFRTPGPRPADLPPLAAEQPVLGYLGSVDERLDYDLIAALARSLPRARFVFVGRIVDQKQARSLSALPNVFLLGSRPPAQLVDYVAAFDVGLIPFVRSALTAGIYPLKINEYLAAGRPVVSTDFGDLSDFTELVAIARDSAAFRTAVLAALATNNPEQELIRRQQARENTWAARARLLGAAIQKARTAIDFNRTVTA